MQKQYTKEFKQEIVSLYEMGMPVKQIHFRYNLSRSSIYEWIYQYKKRINSKGNSFTLNEFEKLQRELEQTRAKLDIIKKTNCLPSSPRKDKLASIEKLFGQISCKSDVQSFGYSSCDILQLSFQKSKSQATRKDR